MDIRGGTTVKMEPRGLNTTETSQFGKVVALNGHDEFMEVKGLKGSCSVDPAKCSRGMSLAFWIRMKGGNYIMHGGSYGGLCIYLLN